MAARMSSIWLAASVAVVSTAARAETVEQSVGEERVGSWILSCPRAGGPCRMRHADDLMRAAAGLRTTLDIERRGDVLVPVVTLRGLTPAAAMGGALAAPEVSMQLDEGSWTALACGARPAGFACAPTGGRAASLAAALPAARRLAVQVRMNMPGLSVPPLDRTLALAGTQEALRRLRARGAVGEAAPATAGMDWRDMLDRALRAVGFQNGTADLLPWVAQWAGGRT